MAKCVVTGVAGFVGSSLADELLSLGHEVLGIDCFIDYYPREVKEQNLLRALSSEKFSFQEVSLLDAPLEKLCAGAEWIFHQAAQAGVRASWGADFSIYTDNNILGTQKLLEAARRPAVKESLKKIVYASSSSVYGHAETLPTTEDMLPKPISPYGVTKLAAEHLCVLYTKEFQVPTASLRYFTVYGPRQRPDMAFNRFIRAGLEGKRVRVFGDGEQSRDFTFISDIVRANISAATASADELVYNIGGGSRVTVNEVIGILNSILGKSLQVEYLPREKGDARHTGADTTLARKALSYQPTVSLEEGLRYEAGWIAEQLG